MFKGAHTLLFLLAVICSLDAKAEREIPYPDILYPQRFSFESIAEDSVEVLKQDNTVDRLRNVYSNGVEQEAFLFNIDNKVFIAFRDDYYWKISAEGMPLDYYTSYSVSAANLDSQGKYELLVYRSGIFSKTGRYSGADNSYGSYMLINLDKEYIIHLKETYTEDYHSYTGFRAGVDATEEEMEKEDEEYFKVENFEHGHDADDCEVRLMPGRVIFEYIDCVDCNEEGIDTVFAIQYDLKNDTLYKGKIFPLPENLSGDFGYKVFRGKIGAYPVTMYLTKSGRYFGGYYYYDKHEEPIGLSDAYYYDSTGAEIVLREAWGWENKIFRGALKEGIFSGKWSDSNKTLDFKLVEDYGNGAVPLKAYTFTDSVIWGTNRVDIDASYYVADTTAMTRNEAIALNAVVFSDKGYSGEEILNAPGVVFKSHRATTMSWIDDELFRHIDDAKFYRTIGWSELYNRNGLLSMIITEGEYMGGARPGHAINVLIYDALMQKRINRHDIFNCPDSVLRAAVNEVHKELNDGKNIEERYDMLDANTPGNMFLKPGSFSFHLSQYPLDEFFDVPVERLEKYIKPEYKKRLLK